MKSNHPIVNERRKVREAPRPHFRRVAQMWSAILSCPVSPQQVIMCMAALKIAREAGGTEPDNIADAIGYLSMMEEVADRPVGPASLGLEPGPHPLTMPNDTRHEFGMPGPAEEKYVSDRGGVPT